MGGLGDGGNQTRRNQKLGGLGDGENQTRAQPVLTPSLNPPLALTRPLPFPNSQDCEGILKPAVVMFGENVPKDVVDRTSAIVERSDGVIAAGTSLMVHSIFRFVRRAHELGIPIAIVNIGPTRGDDLTDLKVSALTSTVFSRLAAAARV